MNINENFSSEPELSSNDICAMAMQKINDLLIEPMQDKLTPEQDSTIAVIGLAFMVMAEKATALEKMEQDKLEEDKTIGFHRN
tara:strand:+ start:295 stop:543 length:249 start_codon:yes stop_codon:yes gene_type:complete